MEARIKHALSLTIDAAIALAEVSGAEVRLTFGSVALVVTPGRSATDMMAEFDAMQKLASKLPDIIKLLLSLFSADEIRRLAQWNAGFNVSVEELPGPGATPRALATEFATLAMQSGAISNGFLWKVLEKARPGRIQDIVSTRHLIES